MPTALRLVSPWWTNALKLRDIFRHWPFATVGARDYADYLVWFAERHEVRVVEGCDVVRVNATGQDTRFVVTTSSGMIHTNAIVFANGYFQTPAQPSPLYPSDESVHTIHASEYRTPPSVQAIAGGDPVVVLGKRVSAGQIMVELAHAGIEVTLSCRPPVEFRRDGIIGKLLDTLYFFYEEVLLNLRPGLRSQSFPVMDGGPARNLVEGGRVRIVPPIRQVAQGIIEFEDGQHLRAGLIIHATGYHAAIRGLEINTPTRDEDGLPQCRDWESVDQPGLYFLGLDNRMNYSSRTLRGIRRDAARLARLLSLRQQHMVS